MKIGLICPYNMARGGAVQEIVRDMRVGLAKGGHDVMIITPEPRDDGDHYDKSGIVFLGNGTDMRTPFHTLPTISASVDPVEIDELLNREKFDILHFHEPWVPMLSRQILAKSKAVNIATFHAKLPETVMSRTITKVVTPYTKSALKYLHALTAVSDAAAEYVSTLTDEPITIIPNGIDLKRYKHVPRRLKKDDDMRTILYIGRLEGRKGVKYLLKAFQQFSEEDDRTRLVIAGDGPDRQKLEVMTDELGLKNVEFLGFVSDAEKMKLLQTADLFCSPALYGESFGIVLLEAMACGLVTIAGANSGYTSVLQEMGTISLVNPRDTDSFVRRLHLLLDEVSLRHDWQNWAKKYIRQFDYPAIISQYEDLYEYALKHHSHHIKIHED